MVTNSTCKIFLAYKTAARIDLHVEVPVVPFKQPSAMPLASSPTSTAVRKCNHNISPKP